MAKLAITANTLKGFFCLVLLAITIGCANSARILDEVDPQPPILPYPPQSTNPTATPVPDVTPQVGPTTAILPSGQIPASTVANDVEVDVDVAPVASPDVEPDVDSPQPEPVEPIVDSPQPEPEEPDTVPTPVTPVVGPTIPAPTGPVAPVATTAGATLAKPGGPQASGLTFFMHDILGGIHPSARVVTGIIANTQINGLPFTTPNNDIFPVSGGVPLSNANLNGILNNNNLPYLAGLNGVGPQASTVIQNSGNNGIVNGGNNLPFVTAGQLPSGATLQKLMFGSLTVIDDELTEGHVLGSAVVGKAQGFYLASSLDGTSQTMAVTVLLHGAGQHEVVEDTISFFGVHRTASLESQIAVVGGTGKYENAKGYATVETLHLEDQHTTDGVDTILQFSVYLSE
ncbi:dirigent protein 24-like [Alnus glutinosa]|uniref:dirigent protein 24-like n=1 Tax=Alnus glutinosa TaxID=3517 RepID=UPI002D7967D7|nr:dirigent protein 24-like [Alnus glutinosa]